MDAVVDRNRLADSHSPYLHQHADNPVNWQPWDEQALTTAHEADVPIFLSVGYAACHWCHVMAEESFENESIAEQLNTGFVPIKVDREERPALDRIYQTVCQQVTGHGGWPLSVWLTPDGRPFYIGTYFPVEPRHGRPDFGSVLDRIQESWRSDRDAIEERADQWAAVAHGHLTPEGLDSPASAPTESPLADAARVAANGADREHGGFGTSGPKFPQPRRVALLLAAATRTDEPMYRTIASEALDAMADRGLHDHVGGGFHRYATDREWAVPHFEKMLYDNAELLSLYLAGYQATWRDRYATVAHRIIEFLTRELGHSDGGFYSSLDAQSDGQEGTFYVWTPTSVGAAVSDATRATLLCERFGITDSGNFENGTTVLGRRRSVADLASHHDLDEDLVRRELETGLEELFAARSERIRPARDEKILASWNGLAISALAEASLVLPDITPELATDALTFIRDTHFDPETGLLHRRFLDGAVGIPGTLDDYAFLGRGALDVHQATGDLEPLAFALMLGREISDRFWDPADGTLYYTDETAPDLVTRPVDLTDQSIPGSVGVATSLLNDLAHFDPTAGFDDIVNRVIAGASSQLQGAPAQHASLVLATDAHVYGGLELTVVGDDVEPWLATLTDALHPHRLVTHRPTDPTLEDALEKLAVEDVPPIWADRGGTDDATTAYLCRARTCSPPLTDPADASDWLDRLG